MKLTKAMKKLKFWSKKKKKKRVPLLERPPSPPPPILPCYYHCPYNYPVQPSAPPLPPWFEYVQPYDDSIYTTEQVSGSTSDNSNQPNGSTISQHIDNVGEINQPKPTLSDHSLPQQYMVQNQVYGIPVRTERAGGAFGCVINFGAHLFRCFFPCFHIRELK
ncbi:uncharacterized protein LOC125866126 [Solanum stenotomum]|uniref:uncharacterized protein LOC125866126 n=1 Tax=Solanum stenotomum TaxID=172797 RepID=UPI0020CFEA95|nr:uncharacterized protein LOC125866126 [Solanum stenotomum]